MNQSTIPPAGIPNSSSGVTPLEGRGTAPHTKINPPGKSKGLNRLLERQLRKQYGDLDNIPEDLIPLFERISHSYDHYESDRQLMERGFDLSSAELSESHARLQREAAELQESRERFRIVAESISDLIYEWYREPDRLIWYGKIDETLGYEPGAFPRTTHAWLSHVHPDDFDRVRAELRAADQPGANENGAIVSFEYRVITKTGQLRYWTERTIIIRDENGEVVKWIGAVTDVTAERNYERRLEESEERFRNVVESLGEGILLTDLQDVVIYSNSRMSAMTGYTREDFFGHEAYRLLLKPEHWEGASERLDQRIQGESGQFEVELLRKDGSLFWALIIATPIRNPDGTIVGTLGATMDITSRKKDEEDLRSSKQNLRALIENTSDTIWSIDRDYRLITFNTPFERQNAQLIPVGLASGLHIEEFHSESTLQFWKEWYERSLTGEAFSVERHFRGDDGELSQDRTAKFSFNPIVSEDIVTGVAVFGRDISEERTLTKELVASKERAEEMNRLKSAFLANMSHEIRTPMTAIMGFTEILLEDLHDPALRGPAETIKRSADRLLSTVNEILDLARIEANTLDVDIQCVAVDAVASRVVELLRPLAKAKGISLAFQSTGEQFGLCDEQFLHQILTNVIGNAVKFTDRGSVTVTVRQPIEQDRSLAGSREFVVAEVRDTGIGISEEFLPHVFEEFKQESSGLARTHEGTGLGLTISRALARKAGGDIEVDSEKDKGSVFYVRFPAQETQTTFLDDSTRMEETVIEEPKSLQKPRILVVEDSEDTRTLIKLMLGVGYDIVFAASSEEAIQSTSTSDYDLIVMDINLGRGSNGLEVTKYLRTTERHAHTPILALTAYAMRGDDKVALAAGCTEYCSKPFTKAGLLAIVNRMIGSDNPNGSPEK